MAAYRRVDDLRSPAGWLPVHRDQLRAQHSVSSMGVYLYKKLSYRRGTARRATSVEVLSSAAQLYDKNVFDKVNDLKGHSRSSKWAT